MNKFYVLKRALVFMKTIKYRITLLILFIKLVPFMVAAQNPLISYGNSPMIYQKGTAITPVTPTATDVSTFGYAPVQTKIFDPLAYTLGPIAIDPSGNMYTFMLNKLIKIPPGGGSYTEFSPDNYNSRSLNIDALGNIYILDSSDPGSVFKVTPAGVKTTVATGFYYPYSVVTDRAGNIYVAENSVNNIKRISAQDGSITLISKAVPNLGLLSMDPAGNLYATGKGSTDIIYKIPLDKTFPVALSGLTIVSQGFTSIAGLAADNLGNLYVVQYNGIIYRVVNGVKTSIGTVGNPTLGCVAIDASGNICITTQNYKIGLAQAKQNGGYYISPALPSGLVFDNSTGAISGTPTVVSAAKDYTVTAYNESGSSTTHVNIAVVVPPSVLITGTLTALNTTYGTASGNTSFNVEGNNLSADIKINAPAGFEISLSAVADFSGAITLAHANGAVASTKIYLRLSADAQAGTYTGNIVVGSVGATNATKAVVSSKVNPRLLVITATGTDKIYDKSLSAVVTLSDDRINNDNITLSYTATFDDANAGLNKPITLNNLVISGAKAANYRLNSNTFSTTASISSINITIIADAQNKVYGTSDPDLTYTFSVTPLIGDNFSGALKRDPGEDVANYAITLNTLTLGDNYNINYVGANLVIDKGIASITLSGLSQTYDGTGKSVTATTDPAELSGMTVTYNGSTILPTDIGTYAVLASLNHANYSATDATGSLVIGKGTASITLSGLSQTYDGTGKSVTATTNPAGLSGITVTYNGSAVLPTNAGTYAIVASLNHANYSASDATGSLVIGKGTASITLSGLSQTYDGTGKSVTATTNPTGLSGITVTYNGSTVLPSNAGTYAVLASLNHANYSGTDATGSLVIGKGTASITLSGLSQTYDGTGKSVTATTDPAGLPGITVTYNGSAVLPTNAGTYAIIASLNHTNYSATDATGSLVVNRIDVTVEADNKTKKYREIDPVLTYKITSGTLIMPDIITGKLEREPGINVGTYAINQGTLKLSNNYNLIFKGASLSIGNSIINFASLPLKNYGDIDFAPVASSSVTTEDIIYSSNNTSVATIVNGKIHIVSAGTASITATQTGAIEQSRVLIVAKAILTVTANNQSKVYGTANPVLTATYNGFVNNDVPTKLTALPVLTTNATINSLPGNYPITLQGGISPDYDFNYLNGALNIVPLANAELLNLSLSSGRLMPAFTTGNFIYTASVDHAVDNLLLTPTLSNSVATLRINGQTALNVPLQVGFNIINIEVIAQDGMIKSIYTLKIYRGDTEGAVMAQNILSPNNDGKNDKWIVKDIELYPNNKVTVFDRAGRTVYTKNGYNNEWDGSIRGVTLVEGTYYYLVDLGPAKRKFKGFITIINRK